MSLVRLVICSLGGRCFETFFSLTSRSSHAAFDRKFSKMSQSNSLGSETVNLGAMRKPYKSSQEAFTEELVPKDPFELFKQWFDLACETDGIKEANAMCIATADKSGRPSARYVLLKNYSKKGFCFFTNHESRKGKELAENPYATLLFYWEVLSRQIRIEGPVEKLDDKESDEYYHMRPRGSQLSALASHQSTVVEGRNVLSERYAELEKLYADPEKVIPKPSYWGGYIVIPKVIEFWQGQTNRLHDRIRFRLRDPGEVLNEKVTHVGEGDWVFERLSP